MLRIICNNFIPSIPSILSWWKDKISQIIDIKIEKYTQYKLSFVVKRNENFEASNLANFRK